MNKMETKAGLMNYEKAKALASSEDDAVRRELAARSDLQPEILYFLAEDPLPEIRCLIAANAVTPIHADLLLARDKDDGVRCGLAVKISRLMPHLGPDAQDKLRDITIEIMEILARDQLDRIRQMVSEALKDVADAPPELIERIIKPLAWDKVLEVAAPILRDSPLLSDADLIELIESEPVQGALAAIADRAEVAGPVADAIVARTISGAGDVLGDAEAVTTLLANPLAQIREETLDRIVAAAPLQDAWHGPLVKRPTLPTDVVRRVAEFVARSLLELLRSRDDLDPETAQEVEVVVRERLAREDGAAAKCGAQSRAKQAKSKQPKHTEKAGQAESRRSEKERRKAEKEKRKAGKEKSKAEKKAAKEKRKAEKKAAKRNGKKNGGTLANGKPVAAKEKKEASPLERALKLNKEGKLDQDLLSESLLGGQRTFVAAALAVLAELPEQVIWGVIDSQSAKGVTALAWKAGMDMRFAHQMQIRLAGIAPNQTLNPLNGTDFPLGEEDMIWQIEFFGG